MNLSTARDLYLKELQLQNYSAATLAVLTEWLGRFVMHCTSRHIELLADVTDEHIQAYYQDLLWQKKRRRPGFLSANTVDIAMRSVRQLFRWAIAQQHLLVDPCRNLIMRRVPQPAPRLLTVAEVEAMLSVPNPHMPGGLRDRAVLETLYATGIRRSECHNLNLADLDLANRLLQVHNGKGGGCRYLPTGEALAATLQRYLEQSRPRLCKNNGETALFLSLYGTRYSVMSMNQLLNDIGRKLNLGSVGCHALRHACASHMLQNGADVDHIRSLLGHRFLFTTQIYTHLVPADVTAEHRRTHPRSQKPGTP